MFQNEEQGLKPLKVLHVMNSLQPSGMERMFQSAQPYWNAHGVAVRVLGQGSVNPHADALRASGVDVVTIPRIGSLRGAIQFARELRAWRPSIVHIHSERSYWIASIIAAVLGFRAQVRTIHSTFRPRRLKRLYRRLVARTTDYRMGVIVACSQDVATNEAAFSRECQVILNWVDDRFFEVLPLGDNGLDSPQPILVVGNCSSIKRHWVALEAALELGLEVIHFGNESGASQEEIQLLEELKKRGKLSARGIHDPAEAMSRTPTFVLPSTHEGMSVSLCEAIAADLPAIVTDAPGLQWARKYGGVTFVAEGDSWTDAIQEASPGTADRPPEVRDELRASRGTADYSRLYRAVARA